VIDPTSSKMLFDLKVVQTEWTIILSILISSRLTWANAIPKKTILRTFHGGGEQKWAYANGVNHSKRLFKKQELATTTTDWLLTYWAEEICNITTVCFRDLAKINLPMVVRF
jgi:hypothetical protein